MLRRQTVSGPTFYRRETRLSDEFRPPNLPPPHLVNIKANLKMKQYLLTTPLGGLAMILRDKADILRCALVRPESVGTLANDQLATKLVTRICRPKMRFIDVGAHIGSIISEVRRGSPMVEISAVEAIPGKATNLMSSFPYIDLHACAAGETTGEAAFYIHTKETGYSSLSKPSVQSTETIVEIKVPIRRLDDLVPFDNIDVVKIDVEGAELGVLRGATGLLNRCRPTLMFESAPLDGRCLGYTKEAMFEFLTSMNYTILVPNRLAHDGEGLTLESFVESHWYPRRTTNYFSVPNERRIEIRNRARGILGIA